MREKALKREMEVVRFRVKKSGQRAVKHGDDIISSQGEKVGYVTSCTLVGGLQQGLGYVRKRVNQEGTAISILTVWREQAQERNKDRLKLGDRVTLPIEATVLSRFARSSTEPGTSE